MYVGSGNTPRPRGTLGSLWSDCVRDGDDSTFQSLNKVIVYPGRINNWLIARAPNAAGTIEDFIADYIVDPLDTSWVNDNVPYVVKKIAATSIQANFLAIGLRLQDKSSSKLDPPVLAKDAAHAEWYLVSFTPPNDAKTQLPWPVQGCLEDPEWYLASATTNVYISTGNEAANVVQQTKDAITTQEAAEAARQEALTGDPLLKYKVALGAAAVGVALIYTLPIIARGYVSFRRMWIV